MEALRPLREHADALRGACVVADAGSASFLAGAASIQTLHEEFGVLAVRRLSDANEPLPPFVAPPGAGAKLCFLLSGFLADAVPAVRRAVEAHRPTCREVVVLCELSDEAQAASWRPVDYGSFARVVRTWLGADAGRPEPRVSVSHMPAQFVQVTPGLFFLPGHDRTAPLLSGTLRDYARASASLGIDAHLADAVAAAADVPLNDVTLDHLPPRVRAPISALAHALSDLFGHLRARMEVWSLGPTSRLLARELLAVPKPPGTPAVTASLVLVDRSLDLASALRHGDSLLDRLLSEGGEGVQEEEEEEEAVPCDPAALFGFSAREPVAALAHASALRPAKEALAALQKRLVEAAMREAVPLPPTKAAGGAAAAHLRPLIAALSAKAAGRHGPLLALASAAAAALEAPAWDEALAAEKALGALIAEGAAGAEGEEERTARGAALARHLADLLTGPKAMDPAAVLCLAAYASSLGGPALDWEAEELALPLRAALAAAARGAAPAARRRLLGGPSGEAPGAWLEARCADVVGRLRSLAAARAALPSLGSLLREAAPESLAAQLARRLADDRAGEPPELEHASLSIGGFLKSGLGRFGLLGQNKPRPASNPLLVFFFVGGVTAQEARELMQPFSSTGHRCQVLVGSSALCTPRGTLGRLLFSYEDALRAELGDAAPAQKA